MIWSRCRGRRRARPCRGSGSHRSTRAPPGARARADHHARLSVVETSPLTRTARTRPARPCTGVRRHRGEGHQVRHAEEVGHEGRRRFLVQVLRRPDLLDPPAFITAMRSHMVSASSWSCVTNTNVMPTAAAAPSARSERLRSFASRAPSGSSSSSTAGSSTSARASATRCCWPPEICAGLPSPGRQPHQLQGLGHPLADLRLGRFRAAGRRRRCRTRSGAGTARSSGTPLTLACAPASRPCRGRRAGSVRWSGC